MKIFWTLSACFFCLNVFAHHIPNDTAEDVLVLIDRAYDYIQKNGKEKSIEAFNNPQGDFVQGELYIFLFNMKGVILAHGANPKLVNKSLLGSKDPNGKYFMKEFIKVAQNQESGWVHYRWLNPETKTIQPKTSFIKRIEGTDLAIGCGYYKK